MKDIEYKDHKIIYKDFCIRPEDEGFYIEAPASGPYAKLTEAKAQVDRLSKIKYIPEPGWRFAGHGWRSTPELGAPPSEYEVINLTVTSPHKVKNEPSIENSFWVKHEDGKRETRMSIYARCAENDKLIPNIIGKAAEAYAALSEVNKLMKQLIPVAIPKQKV